MIQFKNFGTIHPTNNMVMTMINIITHSNTELCLNGNLFLFFPHK